jgi:hypothetical protein
MDEELPEHCFTENDGVVFRKVAKQQQFLQF